MTPNPPHPPSPHPPHSKRSAAQPHPLTGSQDVPINPAPSEDEPRTIDLLQQLKAGTLAGAELTIASRRRIVSYLIGDGVPTPEIAQILKVTERTIDRDKRAIRETNAIEKDPKLVAQMVGRLCAEAELTIQRIRRTTREKEVDPAVRVDGEHRCYLVFADMVGRLQRLGYLPTAAQKVEADLTHHVEEIPTSDDLSREIDRIRRIGGEDTQVAIVKLEQMLTRATIATEIKQFSAKQPGSESSEDGEDASADGAVDGGGP
jgi:hypothetical protein